MKSIFLRLMSVIQAFNPFAKEKIIYKVSDKDILGFTGEELITLEEYVKGKTIEDVEWWVMDNDTLAPTFIFDDGTTLEMYLFSGRLTKLINKLKNTKPAITWSFDDIWEEEEDEQEENERGE